MGLVLLFETFKTLDHSKHALVVMHQVHPCDWSLLSSAVLSIFSCVLSTMCVLIHALKCSRKAWGCHSLLNKKCFHRTAVPFGWCPCALQKKMQVDAMHLLCTSHIYVVPPQSWGDRSDTKHSKCLLLGGRRLNQLTLIPKPKGSGGARAAMAQVGPANNRNDTKRCLPVEASLRPGEAVPW